MPKSGFYHYFWTRPAASQLLMQESQALVYEQLLSKSVQLYPNDQIHFGKKILIRSNSARPRPPGHTWGSLPCQTT